MSQNLSSAAVVIGAFRVKSVWVRRFFFKKFFPDTINMSNSSDSDLAQCFVGPDLGSNYLQKLSVEDIGQRINGNKFHLYK